MTNFRCPICGAELRVEAQGDNWTRQEWNNYAIGPGNVPLEAGTSWYRREPARSPTAADVGVPAAWAGLTGVALSLLSTPLTIWGRWPWWVPLAVLGGGIGLTWLVLLVRWQGLLWRIEEIIGADLDQDGTEGEPRNPEPFNVQWTDPQQKKIEIHHWPVPKEKVREIAEAWQRGVAFSKRELAQNTSLSEDAAMEALRFMRAKAYATYADGNTTVLTGRGEYFFKRLLAE